MLAMTVRFSALAALGFEKMVLGSSPEVFVPALAVRFMLARCIFVYIYAFALIGFDSSVALLAEDLCE